MENRILSGRELMDIKGDDDNYLIEGFLWEHQNIILLAREKVGKSILSVQMACALSCGEAFLGEYEIPEAMPILYIQTESTQHETQQRLKAMIGESGVAWNEDNFHILCTHSLSLDEENCLQWLIQEVNSKGIKPRVIFIDPLYMSMKGSLNDDEKSRALSSNIRRLGEIFNCANVVVHHEHRPKTNKQGGYVDEGDDAIMGSFVWKAFPNHIVHMSMRPDKLRTLSCSTQRSARVIENMLLELIQPNPLYYRIHGTADHMPYVSTVLKYMSITNIPQCAEDIRKGTGLSISAVRKSLMYLSKPNVDKLSKVNPGKRPTLYQPKNGV